MSQGALWSRPETLKSGGLLRDGSFKAKELCVISPSYLINLADLLPNPHFKKNSPCDIKMKTMGPSQLLLVSMGVSLRVELHGPSLA